MSPQRRNHSKGHRGVSNGEPCFEAVTAIGRRPPRSFRFASPPREREGSMKGRARMIAAALVVTAVASAVVLGVSSKTAGAKPTAAPTSNCTFANGIKHVIQIQFDNTHFLRDRANVPSDLEQMPHLLNFIRGNGTMMANDHTILISHTAGGILSTLTGVYPDRMGQPVSNSFRYFRPDGTTRTGVSFAYWTAPLFDPAGPVVQTDFTPEMINENGKIAPAP